jgi:predicted nucleotidyltransferase
MSALKDAIIANSADLCRLYGVRRLGLFGSVARGEERSDSDIDFLAEFESPTPEHMADRYFGFIDEATKRFGRRVQVLTPRMVRNPFLKRSMERDLTILHE